LLTTKTGFKKQKKRQSCEPFREEGLSLGFVKRPLQKIANYLMAGCELTAPKKTGKIKVRQRTEK